MMYSRNEDRCILIVSSFVIFVKLETLVFTSLEKISGVDCVVPEDEPCIEGTSDPCR